MSTDDLAHDGVESNARLTATLGAVLLVALAVEGFTVLGVRDMLTLHVFVGFFVVPVVALKLVTTGYRFAHYYRRTRAYREKGPPHPVLRVAAPLVIVSTVALLATGIVTLAVGPSHADTWRTLHKVSFFTWFALMALHVLGHLLETWRLTKAEAIARPVLTRRGTRLSLVALSVVVGLGLGLASTSWTDAWQHRTRHRVDAHGPPTATR